MRLVTRPLAQADPGCERLQALGSTPGAALIGIARAAGRHRAPPGDPGAAATWPRPLAGDVRQPQRGAALLRRRPAGWPGRPTWWPLHRAGHAPGAAQAGVPAALWSPPDAPQPFDSEALWAQVLQPRCHWPGASALVVRGESGRDWLADVLRQQGARCTSWPPTAAVHRCPRPAARRCWPQALAEPGTHCWLFSSSEAVGHLPALAPAADWSQARALATHPRIAAAARRLGMARCRPWRPRPRPWRPAACWPTWRQADARRLAPLPAPGPRGRRYNPDRDRHRLKTAATPVPPPSAAPAPCGQSPWRAVPLGRLPAPGWPRGGGWPGDLVAITLALMGQQRVKALERTRAAPAGQPGPGHRGPPAGPAGARRGPRGGQPSWPCSKAAWPRPRCSAPSSKN
jgi:uroporphyrinogen-III synthase